MCVYICIENFYLHYLPLTIYYFYFFGKFTTNIVSRKKVFHVFTIYFSDPENTEAADLQRKLEMLNNIMDQEARAEQARRQMQYFGHCM